MSSFGSGFQCEVCLDFKTINAGHIVDHNRDNHQQIIGDALRTPCGYRKVKLQCWKTGSGGNGYWTVTPTSTHIGASTAIDTSSEPISYDFVKLMLDAEREREERLKMKNETESHTTERTVQDDTTDWLTYTKWQRKFQGKKLGVIWAT